jgi:hypothetical protein
VLYQSHTAAIVNEEISEACIIKKVLSVQSQATKNFPRRIAASNLSDNAIGPLRIPPAEVHRFPLSRIYNGQLRNLRGSMINGGFR